MAEGKLDTVVFEGFIEGAHEDGEEDGGGQDRGYVEEGGYEAENPGEQTAPAGEDGEDADDEGGEGRPEGDLVGDPHLGGSLVASVQNEVK